jgi:hypothetical protein
MVYKPITHDCCQWTKIKNHLDRQIQMVLKTINNKILSLKIYNKTILTGQIQLSYSPIGKLTPALI